ncbi:MAG: hypothetical protein CLLPBCKN_004888 [Chroococcidiopsis cubana SAG 39.79]|uniref:hypothetical protein n=1 Tax=Chroococcidiopsis cubana TaxID=171392 RepID=UPI002AC750E0|nr:hypothetical protein [Chroococcidiopsis cubana]MDZ4875492.1 hypothetical protein [Chroococcidiopsis cubana SAG 39.79]
MSEITLTAHQMQRLDYQPTIVDPTTPSTVPVKRYRIKGTGFVVNQIPLTQIWTT